MPPISSLFDGEGGNITHLSGYGMAKTLGTNLFVSFDMIAASMRFSCDFTRESPSYGKADMIVWILFVSKTEVSCSTSL